MTLMGADPYQTDEPEPAEPEVVATAADAAADPESVIEPAEDNPLGITYGERHKAAKILYKPFGIGSSIVGGIVATRVFRLVYKRVGPGDEGQVPDPLDSRVPLRHVVIGALLQGAIFAVVKALVDRGGARVFERWTGEWPGE